MVQWSFSNIPIRAFSVYRQNEGGSIPHGLATALIKPRWQDREDLAWQRLDANGSYSSRSGGEQMNSAPVRQGAKKSQ
jgi:hypothetical protein